MNDAFSDFGRFSEPALHILISLAGGSKHGYAMMLDIKKLTGSKPGAGTLYGALARLESGGWIQPLPKDGRRQPYELTGTGIALLTARLSELQSLAAAGLERLEVPA